MGQYDLFPLTCNNENYLWVTYISLIWETYKCILLASCLFPSQCQKIILVKKLYLLGLTTTANYLHILLHRPTSVSIRRFMTLALPTFLTYPIINNNMSMVAELFHTYKLNEMYRNIISYKWYEKTLFYFSGTLYR